MNTTNAQIFKKLPSWIYKVAVQTWIDGSFPRHIFIETTASCNLSCDYCPREKRNNHISWETFTRVVNEASEYGPRSFSLHLFGEPLMYPRILEAISYIKEKNKSNIVLLTTNGTLLERFYNDLKNIGVDKIIWTWRTEVKWSEKFKEKLKTWKQFTARFIEGTYPNGEEKNWPIKELRRMHNYGGNILTKNMNNMKSMKRWPCYHLWLAPAISWNGEFLMCCSDPHRKEIFGNASKELISDIWKRLNVVRNSHLKGEYYGICKECDVWKEYPDIFFRWQKN